MMDTDYAELERVMERLMAISRQFGLDHFDMRFEIVPSDILYTFGAYQGMPTHFSHWSFGKMFHRTKLDYDLGLSRIYELVINSDPCYAFLLDSNSLVQNKLVSAHVLAHSDFFKHNACFRHTSRTMVDSMAASADRFRTYERKYGLAAVEEVLDAGLALHEHIEPYRQGGRNQRTPEEKVVPVPKLRGPYDDLLALDQRVGGRLPTADAGQAAGPPPAGQGGGASDTRGRRVQRDALEKDLLLYLAEHSKVLKEWQRDILTVLRDEMLYFWPQIETKIMNEGWATYWHLQIMRELDLAPDEALDFARTHAEVVVPSRTSINPYYLGLKMWEDIERRFGRAFMFEVRELESDSSFVRNYLTEGLVRELDLYLYQKIGNEWRIVEQDWEKIRDRICHSRVNGGYPVLYVEDGDYLQNGEIYLWHAYEGVELDVKHTERTLPYVHRLWGKTVHLETVLEGRDVLFTYDGKKILRRFL